MALLIKRQDLIQMFKKIQILIKKLEQYLLRFIYI